MAWNPSGRAFPRRILTYFFLSRFRTASQLSLCVPQVACVAGGSGCARETFCGKALGKAANSLLGERRSRERSRLPSFFSRPTRLFVLAFGTEVRAGTHSRRLRRLYHRRFEPETSALQLRKDHLLKGKIHVLRFLIARPTMLARIREHF